MFSNDEVVVCDECDHEIDVNIQHIKHYSVLRKTRYFCGVLCFMTFYHKQGYGHDDYGDMRGLRGGE